MKYFYLKGMSTSKDEIEYIKDQFSQYGIDLINLIDDYSIFIKMSDKEISKYLTDRINSYGEDVYLISHSMGCNFAFLIWPDIDNLKRAVLVSPEFRKVTKEEKSRIEESTNIENHPSKQQPLSINMLKNIKMFLRSKSWIDEWAYYILSDACSIDIFYSKGDKFVSHDAINAYSDFDNVSVFEIDTNNHNPIFEVNDIALRVYETANSNSLKNI